MYSFITHRNLVSVLPNISIKYVLFKQPLTAKLGVKKDLQLCIICLRKAMINIQCWMLWLWSIRIGVINIGEKFLCNRWCIAQVSNCQWNRLWMKWWLIVTCWDIYFLEIPRGNISPVYSSNDRVAKSFASTCDILHHMMQNVWSLFLNFWLETVFNWDISFHLIDMVVFASAFNLF